jgi:hypothetical protein
MKTAFENVGGKRYAKVKPKLTKIEAKWEPKINTNLENTRKKAPTNQCEKNAIN